MRWDNLQLAAVNREAELSPKLFDQGAVVRTFDTPEFRGMTFYEIRAKSIINRVPEVSRVPFRWTINPYRGCSHACGYCFARNTHTYLDMDAGLDFNSRIVVKVNAEELLRKELASKKWTGEHIAMGTNVDCYQRAEGRYRLMPGILSALRDTANPFSILTKGSLILRDLPLLEDAARVTRVSANVSVGSVDRQVWRAMESGTPSPQKRLEVCQSLAEAGIGCGVLMAPIIPFISDSPAQLRDTVKAIADAGASYVTPIVLHLRPGAREWFMAWLERDHPELVPKYRRLYGRGSYAPKAYQQQISSAVHELAQRFRVGRAGAHEARGYGHPVTRTKAEASPPAAEQLPLL